MFLCRNHSDELGELLGGLASGGTVTETVIEGRTLSGGGWRVERDRRLAGMIEHLTDAALGCARMGDGGVRRAGGARAWSDRDGSAEVLTKCRCGHAEHIDSGCAAVDRVRVGEEPDPLNGKPRPTFEDRSCSCGVYEPRTAPPKLLVQALSSGGINARAAAVLGDLRKVLWDAATRNGFTPLDVSDLAGMALWLADNTTGIAARDDQAGQLHAALTRVVARIEQTVNRRVPPRFCGRCTTTITKDGRKQRCELALYARRDAIEVTCPNPDCRTVHNVERLFNQQLAESAYLRFSREELIGNQRTSDGDRYWTGLMGELGEFVHWQAFYRWVAPGGVLQRPDGFRRPDGRIGGTRHSPSDVPMWRLSNVRKARLVMAAQSGPQKAVMAR
jgi:hypothetical protein